MNQSKKTYEDRRDDRFFQRTQAVLRDVDQRLVALPSKNLLERYAGVYGVLRGYFEALLTEFSECFSSQQLAKGEQMPLATEVKRRSDPRSDA